MRALHRINNINFFLFSVAVAIAVCLLFSFFFLLKYHMLERSWLVVVIGFQISHLRTEQVKFTGANIDVIKWWFYLCRASQVCCCGASIDDDNSAFFFFSSSFNSP